MDRLQKVYNDITKILVYNGLIMSVASPRPYLITKDDKERFDDEAEKLLREGKIEEYNLLMDEKEKCKLYFDEAYKYVNFEV